MQPRFWECLERQPGLAATLLDWQQQLGDDYAWIVKYLSPKGSLASNTAPCQVGCTPLCRRRVVQFSDDHCWAICEGGEPDYIVEAEDTLSHTLDMDAMCRALCEALKLEPVVVKVSGMHQTWQCGFLHSRQGVRQRVYLSIQIEEQKLVQVAWRLCAASRTPQVLLLPTARRMSEPAREVLQSNQTAWTPLDKSVGWSADGRMIADMPLADLLASNGQLDASAKSDGPETIGARITIEKRELADGVHWIVGGVDKGRLYQRSEAKKVKILNTLYDLIGHWVPHTTFIALTGWPAAAYYSSPSGPGLMQRQLSDLRRKLGVAIEFRKDEGVRFAENIVRSH